MNKPLADTITPRTVRSPRSGTDVPVVALMPQAANPIVDRSTHIATAGTSQVLMAENPTRSGFWIQNQNSDHHIFINELGGDANNNNGSLCLAPWALYEAPFGGLSTAKISIWCDTADVIVAAREW